MQDNQNKELERQIKDIRTQIARLTALLALKELEERHPRLGKFAYALDREKEALKNSYNHLAGAARQKLETGSPAKALGIFGAILGIGALGYTILCLLGLADGHRK